MSLYIHIFLCDVEKIKIFVFYCMGFLHLIQLSIAMFLVESGKPCCCNTANYTKFKFPNFKGKTKLMIFLTKIMIHT